MVPGACMAVILIRCFSSFQSLEQVIAAGIENIERLCNTDSDHHALPYCRPLSFSLCYQTVASGTVLCSLQSHLTRIFLSKPAQARKTWLIPNIEAFDPDGLELLLCHSTPSFQAQAHARALSAHVLNIPSSQPAIP